MKEYPKNKVVVRFPPSPTGFLHIGGARTALYNYLFARNNGGKILLRFEDTDKERSKKEFESDICESLKWLGMEMDGEPVRQSERTDIYKKYLNKLVENGYAYLSKEQITNNEQPATNAKRAEVIRFRNPNKKITFEDMIRGKIEFDTTELKDFVIAKSLEEPLYHLAVVIDDFEMGITHVLRGEDHISNTSRQILIQEAIGASRPIYAHIPLILAPDRSKLSKRHGAVSVLEYRKLGYLPEAILNYLALLGWNPGTKQELFTLKELVKIFDLSKTQKGGAIFNVEKLDWLNKEYLKAKPIKIIEDEILKCSPEIPFHRIKIIAPTVLEHIHKLGDIEKMSKTGEFEYYSKAPSYDVHLLKWKEGPNLAETKNNLEQTLNKIESIGESSFKKENIKEAIWNFATEKGRGSVLWPFRVALSGKEKSPDPFTLAEIFGKEETLFRIKTAIGKIQ